MLYHDIGGNNKAEFTAYRLLYYIYTQEMTDLTAALAALTKEEKEDECISHVIKLRQAWVGSLALLSCISRIYCRLRRTT